MSSALVIKNRFDGNEYRVSIIPVCKRVRFTNYLAEEIVAKAQQKEMGMGLMSFDNLIFEAAIFPKKKFFKPLFSIELDDGYTNKMTESEFTEFVHNIIANEKIEDLMNGELDVYGKYGFMAMKHDMWQLFLLSKMRVVFIFKST
jgi:hypothetical protein